MQLRYSTSLTVVKASLFQTHLFLHIARQSLQINLTCLILIEDTCAIVYDVIHIKPIRTEYSYLASQLQLPFLERKQLNKVFKYKLPFSDK